MWLYSRLLMDRTNHIPGVQFTKPRGNWTCCLLLCFTSHPNKRAQLPGAPSLWSSERKQNVNQPPNDTWPIHKNFKKETEDMRPRPQPELLGQIGLETQSRTVQ